MKAKTKKIYLDILYSFQNKKRLLAVLIDPDKVNLDSIASTISKINQSPATHIFIGGSLVFSDLIEKLISKIQKFTNLPILLFQVILHKLP